MPISPEKQKELKEKMMQLNINDTDLIEKFIHGSGKGGQKINKTASCVYIKHIPTGIEVKCQKSRSREDNRFFARRELCHKIENQQLGKLSPDALHQQKIHKQKMRRQRRHTLKELEYKEE